MFSEDTDVALPLLADPRLPVGAPWTAADARRRGISRHVLDRMSHDGSVRRVLRGVYVDATVPDSLELRARALRLVVPDAAVVTDVTAAWLRGVNVLAPGDHIWLPPVSIVLAPGQNRIRTGMTRGGNRGLRRSDVELLNGLRVTTALRTALDLGRTLPRDQAIGALDALLRTGELTPQLLLASLPRFRGYRGVCQLRELVPLADGRSESPGESVLRLRWLDAGLPTPDLQIAVCDERGRPRYRGDLGIERLRYLAEYDGAEFHSTPAQQARDGRRRGWLRARGWIVDVVRKDDVYGAHQTVQVVLREGLRRAEARLRRSA